MNFSIVLWGSSGMNCTLLFIASLLHWWVKLVPRVHIPRQLFPYPFHYTISLQVNFICQHVRKNNMTMGGLQVIVFGDFYQSPLVPNAWTGDPANYCFQSKLWDRFIPHKITLHHVVRQDNEDFIRAISETSRGCPSTVTVEFINHLNHNMPWKTLLYSKRIDLDIANHKWLLQMEGEIMSYNSSDSLTLDAPTQCLSKLEPLFY